MSQLIQQYFEIVLLSYGFSFFLLSIVIYVLPKDNEQYSLLSNLPLIALFGVLHGSHEFMDWAIFRYAISTPLLQNINSGLTFISYLPLFEFGRRMLYRRGYLIMSKTSLIYGMISCAMLIALSFESSLQIGVLVASRVLIGFPGAVLTGLSLFSCTKKENYHRFKEALQISGCNFICYGISTLIQPDSGSVLTGILPTTSSFFAVAHIPVQLVRGLLIFIITMALTHIVRSINLRSRQSELQAMAEMSAFNNQLEYRVLQKTKDLELLTQKLRQDIIQRKKIETALREREFLFHTQFESGNIGIAITSPEKGWLQVNPKLCQMLGYSEAELTQLTWSEMTYPQDLEADLIQFQRMLDGEIDNYELDKRFIRKNGDIIYTHLTVACYRNAGKVDFVIAGLMDISRHKQLEQSLKESKALLNNIIDASQAVIYMKDLEGRYVHVNQLYKKLFHLSTEMIIGKTDYQIFPQQIADGFRSNDLQVIGSGKPLEIEELAPHDDGIHTYISIKVPLRNSQGEIYATCGISTDITERKKIETEKEQFFRFFKLSPDLQCIAGADGYFKQLNPAFTDTLGFSKQELLAKPFIEFILPEDRERTRQEVSKQLENQSDIEGNNGYQYVTMNFENRYFCKDGSFRWLSWKAIFNPTDSMIYATARDITKAKAVEEKLQLAEMVYQNSMEGILITDENNKIIAVNPALTKITGYTESDVLGKNPSMFKSGQYTPEFYQSMWQSINTQGHWQGEMWDKRKNGELHAKFLSIKTIRNQEGQIHRYLGLFSDITERKKYEEEIRRLSNSELYRAKQEAEKANKAKSEFLSSMSHELRTPMNAVLGFAQLLETEDLTEDQLDSVKEILTAGHHLMDLINEVLDLAKIEADKLEINLEKVELKDLLKTCLSLIQPLAIKNKITINDITCDACHSCVMVDRLRFKQVLLNLISNAIKYNRAGGSVTLSCCMINPETLRFSVIDTGRGLSEEQISKLFQPFERLDVKNSNIEGTGIGLLITKKLIEAMSGSIGVTSTVGEGSCFWVEVPIA